MTQERKNLYRKLLYTALIDLRGHSYESSWQEVGQERVLRFINSLTDWIHNLAFYSSNDFEDFNEEWFWRDYQTFREQYPADKWAKFLEGTVTQLRK
ncbi:hypothetical protein [Hymenobacter sp. UYCo722]|uniref:hypothetical protein n=1 Tax=Hymenobacter sp. UYCo722 TaxID=3156335 RepID=UPI003396AD40